MSTNDTSPLRQPDPGEGRTTAHSTGTGTVSAAPSGARVGTVVWGLIVLALATLIIISNLGLVALNGTYVLIGLMLGAGAALVIGGLLSTRNKRSTEPRP